jgi:hypothetical protein
LLPLDPELSSGIIPKHDNSSCSIHFINKLYILIFFVSGTL